MQPSSPTPGHLSAEKHGLKEYMHPSVHCSTIQIVKTWKQPRIYIYICGILFSHKNEIMPFTATWMDLEIIIPSEVRDKYMTSLLNRI